jgi:hypothetical protein
MTTSPKHIYLIKQHQIRTKCPYEIVFVSEPKVNSCLNVFGKIETVKTKGDFQGSLKYRGIAGKFDTHCW